MLMCNVHRFLQLKIPTQKKPMIPIGSQKSASFRTAQAKQTLLLS